MSRGIIILLTAVSCIVERLRGHTEHFKSLLHISMKREGQPHNIAAVSVIRCNTV